MRALCEVDVSAVLPLLDGLAWRPSGVRPWDGAYGMIGWGHFPRALAIALESLARQALAHLPGRVRGTTFLARLVPGQHIEPHTDQEDCGCTVRVHVPLVTNPEALLFTDGAWHHMEAGLAYVIDPTKKHAVVNGGKTDRVHLLFNAVEG